MKTHFWQFFGPAAEPTARHFEQHLLEFLRKHELRALETGVILGPGQALVFGCAEPAAGAVIEGALKPQESVDGGLPEELRSLLVRGTTSSTARLAGE